MKVLRDIYATCEPFIGITATPLNNGEDLAPWSSKFGGLPYIPKGMDYPKDTNGNPLNLLVQINFADFPTMIDPFPKYGLLQFYISEDDLYGMSFDETDKEGFKVNYIPNDGNYSDQDKIRFMGISEDFPMTRVHRLDFYSKERPLPLGNPQFDKIFESYLNISTQDTSFDELYARLIKSGAGHQIGGYPSFTQGGPDCYENGKYKTQLLQIDTDTDISFGDCGIANFLIKEDDLRNLNFNDVVFYWDCH